ncbi:MAG: outer membrane lipid asymmetry maintenance protein MlaD [Magnetococcales bacterium]|nr:outer membrane lipid asymmetry maintenance protein MlaD [Magnetococcales bacterium]
MTTQSVKLELAVGVFVLTGILALAWLSVKMARMELVGGSFKTIHAHFTSIAGLRSGASVEISGVEVGRVKQIDLDVKLFDALVTMNIRHDVPIQEDAIASVRTKGLIGDRYVKIAPGGSDTLLKSGDRLVQTEPAIDFEELISQFIHGSVK